MSSSVLLRTVACVLALLAAPLASAGREALPPESEVMEMLRKIETERLRGSLGKLRIQLESQTLENPADVMLPVYKAWLSFPADTCWNALKASSALHPENPWPYVGMGLIYVRWGMLEEARGPISTVLQMDPRLAAALWADALRLQAKGQLAEAEARFHEALVSRDEPWIRADLGLLLAKQKGRELEARRELARAVEAWPEQPEALQVLARLARDAHDLRVAAEVGEKLVALKPHEKEAHRLQAGLWQDAGEKQKAVQSLEQYVALGGADPAELSRLARLCAELGDAVAEAKALTRLAAAAQNEPEPLLRLAELAEAKGDPAAAESYLVQAASRAPRRSDILVRRARLLVKQGRQQDALEVYRAALAAPENPVAEAAAEAEVLVQRFRLPATPAQGPEDKIYSRVSLGLVALYMERLKEKPDLKGVLKVRVQVDESGHATQVTVVHDTLKDELISGHAYFAFKDAQYLPARAEPVFTYVFRPPKGD
jgi:tetratricopeptide (TPR) repeat protein